MGSPTATPTSIRAQRWVALDLEMTGLDPSRHSICEVGLVWGRGGVQEGAWSTLVRPGTSMDTEAQAIHGIAATDVEHAPTFADLVDELRERLRGARVVAHGASMDRAFLDAATARLGQEPLPILWHDSLEASRRVLALPRHRLDDVCVALGVPRGVAHRAEHDAAATLELWWRLLALVDPAGELDAPDFAKRLRALKRHSTWRRAIAKSLKEAAYRRRVVSLRYVSTTEAGEVYISEREVEVHRVRRGKLEGHCRLRGEPRVFRLDRIHGLALLEETFAGRAP